MHSEDPSEMNMSVQEYFKKASHDRLNVTYDVTDFYTSSRNASEFSDEESNTTYNFEATEVHLLITMPIITAKLMLPFSFLLVTITVEKVEPIPMLSTLFSK